MSKDNRQELLVLGQAHVKLKFVLSLETRRSDSFAPVVLLDQAQLFPDGLRTAAAAFICSIRVQPQGGTWTRSFSTSASNSCPHITRSRRRIPLCSPPHFCFLSVTFGTAYQASPPVWSPLFFPPQPLPTSHRLHHLPRASDRARPELQGSWCS